MIRYAFAIPTLPEHGLDDVQVPTLLAVGCAPPDTFESLSYETDEAVIILTPENFSAVGYWYEDFRQVSDHEVCATFSR